MGTYTVVFTQDFYWLASAVSKEEGRSNMKGVSFETIKDGHRCLIATDGVRMHILRDETGRYDSIPDGVYKPTLPSKKAPGESVVLEELDVYFPFWKNVMPDMKKFTEKVVITTGIVEHHKAKTHQILFEVYACGIAVCQGHLLDLEKVGFAEWYMYSGKSDVVQFDSGNRTAVIMQLKHALCKPSVEQINQKPPDYSVPFDCTQQ